MNKFALRIVCLVITVFIVTYCKRQVEETKPPPKTIPLPQKAEGPFKPKDQITPTPKHGISGTYRGNAKTKVFHGPGCPAYECPNCTVGFMSKRQAKRSGFKPHRCVEPRKYKRKKHKVKKGPP